MYMYPEISPSNQSPHLENNNLLQEFDIAKCCEERRAVLFDNKLCYQMVINFTQRLPELRRLEAMHNSNTLWLAGSSYICIYNIIPELDVGLIVVITTNDTVLVVSPHYICT